MGLRHERFNTGIARLSFICLSAVGFTLPETNMETQEGPYEDYSPSKRGLYGFAC